MKNQSGKTLTAQQFMPRGAERLWERKMLQHLDRVFDAKQSITQGGVLCGISSPYTSGGGHTHKK